MLPWCDQCWVGTVPDRALSAFPAPVPARPLPVLLPALAVQPAMLFSSAARRRRDLFVYIVAFVATLGLGIEQGILIGAAISLVRVVQESSKPHVAELGLMPDDVMPGAWRSVKQFPGLAKPRRGLRVVRSGRGRYSSRHRPMRSSGRA